MKRIILIHIIFSFVVFVTAVVETVYQMHIVFDGNLKKTRIKKKDLFRFCWEILKSFLLCSVPVLNVLMFFQILLFGEEKVRPIIYKQYGVSEQLKDSETSEANDEKA